MKNRKWYSMLLVLGCLAFLLMMFYDLNQVKFHWGWGKYMFMAGGILLLIVTGLLINNHLFDQRSFHIGHLFAAVLCMINTLLLVYTLFFALPFEDTYVEQAHLKVYDQGVYALCRHPGILWFFFAYTFLSMTFSSIEIAVAAILFSVMNLLYAYMQDRFIFPKTLEGYKAYCERVPFLIPTRQSLKESLKK